MRLRFFVPILLCLGLLSQNSLAQEKPALSDIDRVRLAEVFRLGADLDSKLWKDWDRAPFAVLLVTPETEFLIRHPEPSPDFTLLGYDSILKANVSYRKRTQRTDFLATFPAIKGSMIPTIVVGQAENTSAKTSTPWVVTLLHEHFHQLQYSQPNYYTDVNALGLSGGDQTGMWMLNYPFPYDKKEVQAQFSALSRLLVGAVEAKGASDRTAKLTAYLQARRQFQQLLSPGEYKYLSFQLWQEGIARYTELRVAEFAGNNYKPSSEFRALKDFTPFAQVASAIRNRIREQLLTQELGRAKRDMFYPFGGAEGLLLDRVQPTWRRRYLSEKFELARYLEASR
jgi:hypothetical protein